VEAGCVSKDGCGYDQELIWTCSSDKNDCDYSTDGICAKHECNECVEDLTWEEILIKMYGDGDGKGIFAALNTAAGAGAAAIRAYFPTTTDRSLSEMCCSGSVSCSTQEELYGVGILFVLIGLPLAVLCGACVSAEESDGIYPDEIEA
jgi:hypothetical protein